VDALWVRGLGVDATAAVTTSVFVLWSVYSLNDVIAIGVVAYVSQLLGAGERERAGQAAYFGLRASAVLGLLAAAVGLVAARPLYGLMGATPHVAQLGGSYLSIVLGASPFFLVALTCESVLRAGGDSRTPFLVDLGAVTLNAILDPLLIYGYGPFPRLGVAGAAWATLIAQAAMAATYLTLAARRHPALPIARRAPGPPIRLLSVARVGAPAAVIGMLFSVVYMMFAASASRFGAASMALVGIGNRIEAISYLAAVAVGIAAATVVGQNLGAGYPERAALAMRTGVRWSVIMSLPLTAVLFLFPHVFLGLFSTDPEVHRLGPLYLRILAACLVFNCAEIVLAEAVMGSGHTTAISIIFCSFSLLRLPLAWWVPDWTGWGVWGIAVVISGTCAARSLLIIAWTARGTWRSGLAKDVRQVEAFAPLPPAE
jgi:putative MATE family efflux protein